MMMMAEGHHHHHHSHPRHQQQQQQQQQQHHQHQHHQHNNNSNNNYNNNAKNSSQLQQQRRSARISALDTWRLSELTRASGATRGKRKKRGGGHGGRGRAEPTSHHTTNAPPNSSITTSSSPVAPASSLAVRGGGGGGKKRGRKKRRLRPVVEVAVNSVDKLLPVVDDQQQDQDKDQEEEQQQVNKEESDDGLQCQNQEEERHQLQNEDLWSRDRLPSSSSTSWMPDKKVLELILDVLQKKDTHEIFAEPVDAEEVEGYYDIIEEPMDFGTMRAKLQEGMYASLEQFERDVFLISSNAMHFNSTTTIYYRQARSIQELAKKTFHKFRTDPEIFLSECSAKKSKSGRLMKRNKKANGSSRAHGQPISSSRGSSSKRTILSNNTSADDPPDLANDVNSRHRRTSIDQNPLLDWGEENEDFLGWQKDGLRFGVGVEDRRSSFTSWNPFQSRSNEVCSSLLGDQMEFVYVNQGDFGYVESLTRFVADLGPIAQKVAQRKLSRFMEPKSSNCNVMQLQALRDRLVTSSNSSTSQQIANASVEQLVQSSPGYAANPTGMGDSQTARLSCHPGRATPAYSQHELMQRPEHATTSISQSKLLEMVSMNVGMRVPELARNGAAAYVYSGEPPTNIQANIVALPGSTTNTLVSYPGSELAEALGSSHNFGIPSMPDPWRAQPVIPNQQCQRGLVNVQQVQGSPNGISLVNEDCPMVAQLQGLKTQESSQVSLLNAAAACERPLELSQQSKPSSLPDQQKLDLALQL